jgi:isopentenyl phosphate kinase
VSETQSIKIHRGLREEENDTIISIHGAGLWGHRKLAHKTSERNRGSGKDGVGLINIFTSI